MVKLSTVVLAIAGALVGLSSADNCKDGLYYCGYNLLSKGMPFTRPSLPISQNSVG